jgi:hypothetical protein
MGTYEGFARHLNETFKVGLAGRKTCRIPAVPLLVGLWQGGYIHRADARHQDGIVYQAAFVMPPRSAGRRRRNSKLDASRGCPRKRIFGSLLHFGLLPLNL